MTINFRKEFPNHFQLPERINCLGELAYNLWWTWNPTAMRLYLQLDRRLWEKINHNPIAFLHQVEGEKLKYASENSSYLEEYDRIMALLDAYMGNSATWFASQYPQHNDRQMAYFSFEFGLHESMPFYAGGLGILSGDHLKEASDLGMPIVGMGFIYKHGYFMQKITEDGWQETGTFHFEFEEMPLISLVDDKGDAITVSVDLPGRTVKARVWMLQVGRVPLFLLDTSNSGNEKTDKALTSQLYSGDPEIRISQEILLGIGGVRALRRLGFAPSLWHMNEGHSAFLTLERAREFVVSGLPFEKAVEKGRKNNVFNTHTPVSAAKDHFPI